MDQAGKLARRHGLLNEAVAARIEDSPGLFFRDVTPLGRMTLTSGLIPRSARNTSSPDIQA